MLLLSGPGSSPQILAQIRAALGRGATDFRLLVPTATMAEHRRNQMAREGFLLRPNLILTLSKLVEAWTEDLPEVSTASLELLVEGALARVCPSEFRRVAHLPGFRASLVRLIDEISSTGCDSRRLTGMFEEPPVEAPLAPAFLAVFREVESELERRGWILRAGRLSKASEEIRSRGLPDVRHVLLEGFFSLTEPELDLIDAIRRHAEVTVALPRWGGSEAARASLLAMGFSEGQLLRQAEACPTSLFVAPSLEQEAYEIARRILEQVAAGRQFREIAIVLRSQIPYLPVLETALERFGIPARFYFAAPLADHASVRYLTGWVDAMLSGWDHQAALELLKMAASGFGNTPACDRLDFALRQRLPGKGLAGLREISGDGRVDALLDRLARLDSWRASRLSPREWAEQAKTLRTLVHAPRFRDRCAHHTALLWRGQAAALEAFDRAMEEAASALPAEPAAFSDLWEAARVVLEETRLRVPDHRRNVVHVLDAEEARQWELPVVFVCGLLEKQFPRYHAQDPIFPDAARARLRPAGLRLETTADLERQEEFLFELAATRATSELVLSYPEYNAKGEPNLPSFFLDRFTPERQRALPVRPPASSAGAVSPPAAAIRDEQLLEGIRTRHAVLRPSAIEDFLQCPFRFFVNHTLELEPPPVRPEERLDPLVQGGIVHWVLAQWQRERQPLEPLFERIFQQVCAEKRVLAGCRTELARLRMLQDLRRFVEEPPLLEGWETRTEESIRFVLGEGAEISGRIDRYDVKLGLAVVFDFKYTSAQGIRKRVQGYGEDRYVQGALYLLGLEERFGYQAAGLFYYGLRGGLTLNGWHTGLAKGGTSCTPEVLRELLDRARALSLNAARQIRAGKIGPEPADPDRCEYCAARDFCRVTAALQVAAAGGAVE